MERRGFLQAMLCPLGSVLPADLAPPAPPPLRDEQGRPLAALPEAVPRDSRARTRAGRYATGAQALALEQSLGAGLVHVHVRGAPGDVLMAVQRTLERRGLPASTPILVAGPDPAEAARAADALEAAGYPAVWVVTR